MTALGSGSAAALATQAATAFAQNVCLLAPPPVTILRLEVQNRNGRTRKSTPPLQASAGLPDPGGWGWWKLGEKKKRERRKGSKGSHPGFVACWSPSSLHLGYKMSILKADKTRGTGRKRKGIESILLWGRGRRRRRRTRKKNMKCKSHSPGVKVC